MRRVQVIEFAETYTGLDNNIVIYYRDQNNVQGSVTVVNPPMTVCVAVGEKFTAVDSAVADLNAYLAKCPPSCNKLECACGGDQWGVFRYPCKHDRVYAGYEEPPVVSARIVRGRGILVFEENDRPFLEFTFTKSFYASSAVNYLEKVNYGYVDPRWRGAYDKKANGVESFILEKRVASFDWIEIPALPRTKISFSEVRQVTAEMNGAEVDVVSMHVDIETIASEPGPYRDYLSKKAAYQVGLICTQLVLGSKVVPGRCFMMRSEKRGWDAEEVVDSDTTFYTDERKMLMDFRDYVMETNPDLFLGYYSNTFDFPYLMRRAALLGLSQFRYFSREPGEPVVFREELYESKQTGIRKTCKWNCPGRIFYDVATEVRKSYKFASYKLAKVAKELDLGQDKLDVKYADIHDHFHGSVETRALLLKYCKRDVLLTVLIAENKMDLVRRLRAMCRQVRVNAQNVPDRGNSYLLGMMMRQYMKGRFYALAKQDRDVLALALEEIEGYEELWTNARNGIKYPGAFVFPPVLGAWNCCVFTLDFNSLYPSIMSTFNICPTTQLPSKTSYPADKINISPAGCGFAYVKEEVRKGILPALVESLIDERKRVRAQMETESDPSRVAMLNAVQLVLKVCANSFYGLMGSLTSILSSLSAAYSVTAYGRYYIQMVCDALMEIPDFESKYGFAVERPGFVEKYGLRIIYGDTDSLFNALLKCTDPALVSSHIGPEIAAWVNTGSKLLIGKLKMGLEKCSYPFLLNAKKKYVKVLHGKKGPELSLSGIENRSVTQYGLIVLHRALTLALVEGASVDAVESFIVEACGKLWRGEVPRYLLRHSNSINKSLDEYKALTPHLIAARQLRRADIEVNEGDRIAYYFCDIVGARKGNKGDLVVAADLMTENFTLHARSYVDEIQSMLSNTIMCFIRGATFKAKEDRLKMLCKEAYRPSTKRPQKAPAWRETCFSHEGIELYVDVDEADDDASMDSAASTAKRPRMIEDDEEERVVFAERPITSYFARQEGEGTARPVHVQGFVAKKTKSGGRSKKGGAGSTLTLKEFFAKQDRTQ